MSKGMVRMDDNWHLDKRVNLSVIIVLILQTLAWVIIFTAWKTDTDNRLASLEKSTIARESHENRLVILEQKFGFIQETLARIEGKLDGKSDIQRR